MLRHLTKKDFQLTILCLLCVYNSHAQTATNRYGRVEVEITKEIVDKDGNISDIKPLTSNGYGMEAEVLRAIKKKAVWLPTSQRVPVKPYRTSSATPSRGN